MAGIGFNMDDEVGNIDQDARPSSGLSTTTTHSGDSGIGDQRAREDQDGGPKPVNLSSLPTASTSGAASSSTSGRASLATASTSTTGQSGENDPESELDQTDHEEGEISDSETEYGTADEDSNPRPSGLRSLAATARSTFRQDRLVARRQEGHQGSAARVQVRQLAQEGARQRSPTKVVDRPLTASAPDQVAQVAPHIGALVVSGPVVPVQGAPVAAAAAQLPAGRGRNRGRGRPRRRQVRKRPWDLSDESLSPADEEASFPSRISPRKKPYQGYRY